MLIRAFSFHYSADDRFRLSTMHKPPDAPILSHTEGTLHRPAQDRRSDIHGPLTLRFCAGGCLAAFTRSAMLK